MSKPKKESPNDIAWRQIFEEFHLLDKIAAKGKATISASDIKRISAREPRLMTKFDHHSQLPKPFIENGLSILPTSRGSYEIGPFETFCDLSKSDSEFGYVKFPDGIESLNYSDITSEAIAINCAFVTEMLHDFTGEQQLAPTVNGRMSSSKFDFHVATLNGTLKVKVDNSQVEIDGGYEGDNSLTLIEAKNYISDDFLIRQLYYPYRLWQNKVSKRVRPVFFTYSNGIFHLREYEFSDAELYNSIRLVKEKRYVIWEGAINMETIQQILNDVKIVEDPVRTPFPQANSFERVVNLCELLSQSGFLSKDFITNNYLFTSRQTDYYCNAAKYLGLAKEARIDGEMGCVLSSEGQRVFALPLYKRQLEFVRLILSHRVFNDAFRLYLLKATVPSAEEMVEIMRRAGLYNMVQESTVKRRAQSVLAWINWILELIEE